MSAESEMYNWIAEHTNMLIKPDMNGEFYRFNFRSKTRSNLDGWFVGSVIGKNKKGEQVIIASLGSWKTNERQTFRSYEFDKKDKEIEKKIQNEILKIKKKVDVEKKHKQKMAAVEAKKIWSQCYIESSHPYLINKKLSDLYGARILDGKWNSKDLVVPMINESDELVGLQKITAKGKKFFHSGQRTKGCFHLIGAESHPPVVYIGEGFATMATVHMATSKMCVVAFNANNMVHVTEEMVNRFPYANIVYVGDDDAFTKDENGKLANKGREVVEICINKFGGFPVFPFFKSIDKQGTDFNDLHIEEGLETVRKQLDIDVLRFETPKKSCVFINGQQPSSIIKEVWSSIRFLNRPNPVIYKMEDSLVQVVQKKTGSAIKYMDKNDVYGFLIRKIDWFKSNKEEEKAFHATPSKEFIANDVLSCVDGVLPAIDFITKVPILGPGKSIVAKRGYSPIEKIYGDPSGFGDSELEASKCNRENAMASLDYLVNEVLIDFPFRGERDLANFLGLLIQIFIRPAINGPTPLTSIEAVTPGTGKTFLAVIASIIATGDRPQTKPFPKNDEEMRKTITATLMEAPRFILMDNAEEATKGTIDSATLAAVITSQNWSDRVLNHSRVISIPNNASWVVTVNNPVFSPELRRRRVPVELFYDGDPCSRTEFKHKSIILWTLENKVSLCSKLATIVQYWVNEGCPRSNLQLASFEEWSANVGGVLELLGVKGFLQVKKEEKNIVPKDWSALAQLWSLNFDGQSLGVSELNKFCEDNELLKGVRGEGVLKSQETKLGMALGKIINYDLGFHKIELDSRGGRTKSYKLVSSKKREIQ